MAEKPVFTHITVNPGEDEDIVIQAGASAGEKPPSSAARPISASPAAQRGSEKESDRDAAAASAVTVKDEDGYKGTTLDDLKSSKMGTTQKAVIVVALVALVAFVLWYTVLRG